MGHLLAFPDVCEQPVTLVFGYSMILVCNMMQAKVQTQIFHDFTTGPSYMPNLKKLKIYPV